MYVHVYPIVINIKFCYFTLSLCVLITAVLQDVKVLKTLTRIVDEWVRSRQEVPLYSLPSLREISLLVSRMMVYYEKRFPDDMDLLSQFLEIVLYIYKCVRNGLEKHMHVQTDTKK